MSIITELMDCIRTANRSYEDARNPYNDREILHIPEEELTAIAKRIRKANNEAINKAHADGERNALKQNRSRSADYRRGYADGYANGQEDGMDNIDGGTEVERIETGITDKLRLWAARELASWKMARERYDDLIAIADRIDVEYAAYRAAVSAIPKEYVKLPVDADGVPIHVGDVMTNGEDLPSAVCCMLLRDGGWTVESRALYGFGIRPSTLRHVQPDSWESIIADALFGAERDGAPDTYSDCLAELVERCRRLAGEGN